MKRFVDTELNKWKDSKNRKPLIIRGARQVGKTYSVEEFGKRSFINFLTLNFEFNHDLKNCFVTLDPAKIVKHIELLLNATIVPGETLLFFDEIQECPQALKSLRYFKEKMPKLHVVAAGSLLEFVLNDEQFTFPVGRVDFLYMKPLSFEEFLLTQREEKLLEYIKEVSLKEGVPEVIHNKLIGFVKEYCLIGGMPESIMHFHSNTSYAECQKFQKVLLVAYESDFAKYASKIQHKHLQTLFSHAPDFVGTEVKYSKIDKHEKNPARTFKPIFNLLLNAGLVQKISATSANGIPLRSEVNPNKFKLLYLDTGLYQCAMGVNSVEILEQDITHIHNGALAEQFVGQELTVLSEPYENKTLYFWKREKLGSTAEVDYVQNINGRIIPIEVKSGKTGRLRSIKQFMEEKKLNLGVRVSQKNLSLRQSVLSVPFYLLKQLPRLVKEALCET